MGSVSSICEPWPNYWPSTSPNVFPTYPTYHNSYIYPQVPKEEYANEVEVERGEHDAVLRFYRTRDARKTLIKEVTVPLGLLDFLQAQE